jgi:hypothetical protein
MLYISLYFSLDCAVHRKVCHIDIRDHHEKVWEEVRKIYNENFVIFTHRQKKSDQMKVKCVAGTFSSQEE